MSRTTPPWAASMHGGPRSMWPRATSPGAALKCSGPPPSGNMRLTPGACTTCTASTSKSWVSTAFLGFFMFMALWPSPGSRPAASSAPARRDPDAKNGHGDLAAMLQVSIIGYAAGGAFLGLAYFDYYYHLIASGGHYLDAGDFKPDFYTAKAPTPRSKPSRPSLTNPAKSNA
jgi:hypothetical protein